MLGESKGGSFADGWVVEENHCLEASWDSGSNKHDENKRAIGE